MSEEKNAQEVQEEELKGLKERISELEGKNDELKGSNTNIVEELKKIRKEKQELEQKLTTDEEGDDVTETVKKVLSEERQGEADSNKNEALENFISNHKEFHTDNDEGEIKASALKREFEALKSDNIYAVRDFEKLYEKALKLMPTNEQPKPDTVPADQSTPPAGGSPPIVSQSNLTDKEKKLLKDSGFSEEKYLELKQKNPNYIASLLEQVR